MPRNVDTYADDEGWNEEIDFNPADYGVPTQGYTGDDWEEGIPKDKTFPWFPIIILALVLHASS